MSKTNAGLHDRASSIGVIGLGYVGLPLAHAFVSAGFRVLGFDTDDAKVDALASGRPYLDHLAVTMFEDLGATTDFEATSDMTRLGECDAIIVAVPTPLGPHQEPDLSYVAGTAAAIGRTLRAGQLIVLESTTYPGTTRDVFLPTMLEAAPHPGELVVGNDVHVAYSPEREDPGRDTETTAVPKLVAGLDNASTERAVDLYSHAFAHVVAVESAEIAEAAKLLENIFRAVNIALVNEMKVALTALDIDIWKVIDAAATKPFGFMPFYPGPGLGGHCIPIDPFYLTWKAREVDQTLPFIEHAGLVNRNMPRYVLDRLIAALNEAGKALSTSRVLVIGLAYKAGVGDTRESPSYELIDAIQKGGGEVAFHDELAPATIAGRRFDLQLESIDLDPSVIRSFDAVVIATAQTGVDWKLLADHARLVVDTRNAMAPFESAMGNRLVKA